MDRVDHVFSLGRFGRRGEIGDECAAAPALSQSDRGHHLHRCFQRYFRGRLPLPNNEPVEQLDHPWRLQVAV